MNNKVLKIYTDGSANNIKKIGGYAFIFDTKGDEYIYGVGNSINTTSNRMELKAVIEALKILIDKNIHFKNIDIEIFSDSMYVIKSMTVWAKKWEKNNFQNIENRDLIIELYELVNKFTNINFIHVKAHNSGESPFNEWCDTKAKEEMRKLK